MGEVASEFQSGEFISATEIIENGDYPVYGGNGLRGYANRYNHEGFYALIGRQGALCGNVNCADGKAYFTEHAVAVQANQCNDTGFLVYLLSRMNLGQYSGQSAQPGLAVSTLKEVETLLPSKHEQYRIGSLLKDLDSLITLHQRKCQYRGLYGYLSWEQRKFSDLVLIERGGSPRPIDAYITEDPAGLNWVKIGDAPSMGRYITTTSEKIKPEGLSKTRQVYPGDLVLSNSMSFGRPYIMAVEGCIHDGWLLIRDTQNQFDPVFLCHMLGTPQMLDQYRMFASGSTVNNLNKELVGNTMVPLPDRDEQVKIGNYLDELDGLITLHQ